MAGAAEMRLAIEISARDATGGAFKSAEQKVERFSRGTKRQFKDLIDVGSSYRKLVGAFVTGNLMAKGFGYLENTIMNVTQGIIGMDTALTAAAAKFDPQIKRGTGAFAEMEKVSREIAATTEWTGQQTAQGINFLAMAGFNYAESLNVMRPLTDLATASQLDLARASDIASDALGAFNMATTPDEIEKNLTRINDVFAATVTSSNVNMENMFDTMKLAGPVVKGGVAMFGTLTGVLGSAGIKGSIAATTLKNMFLRLQAPPSEARKSLKKLGVEVDDGTGKMDNMIKIIGKLNVALAGKNAIQREKFLKDIFGMRAISGVNVLLRKGETELQAYHDKLDASSGKAKDLADAMRNSLGVQIEVLQSTIMSKGMDIFKGLMGETDPVESIKELIDVIRGYDVTPIVEGLREIGHFAKATAEFLWENREMIMAVARVWLVTNLATKVTNFTGGLAGMVEQMSSFGGAAASAADSTASLTSKSGKLAGVLAGIQPVVVTLIASLQTGYEIYKAMERQQGRAVDRENKIARYTFGKDVTGKDLTWQQKQQGIKEMQAEWKQWAYERRAAGEEDLQLMTGELSSIREQRMVQEAARGLSKSSAEQKQRYYKNLMLREEEFKTGKSLVEPSQTSSQFYQGQGFGKSSYQMDYEKGRNATQMDQSWRAPQVTWTPKMENKVTVEIGGDLAALGLTATAGVKQVPSVPESALGVPNG